MKTAGHCLLVLLCLLALPLQARVTGDQLGVIVNTQDEDSQKIAAYYRQKRGIPERNIIRVSFPPGRNALDEKTFNRVYREVQKQTPAGVQYYALAWSKPFRVACMSVTSAFAFGFDRRFCAKGCKPTRLSAYYNSDSDRPKDELGITPTMMLAGSSLQQVYAMIDRGVAADGSRPQKATAYLLSTSDRARNTRAWRYPVVKERLSDRLPGSVHVEVLQANVLKDRKDVMFYFTGLTRVNALDSLTFLPGAIADHLTSSGGNLFGTKQMSILRWLDAGATASYGTVVEPCAFTQKFPNPGIVIQRYTGGESLIQAYWKSVAWPGQGVFVGEPLASPWHRPGAMQ